MTRVSNFLLAAAVAGCAGGWALAAPVPSAAKADGESAAQKARKALDTKVTCKADGKPIGEAVELLNEAAKVSIAVDVNTIQSLGMDPGSTIVSFDLKNVTLKEGLRKAFAPLRLKCGVTPAGLVLSTEERLLSDQLRHKLDVAAADQPFGAVAKGLADQTGANVVLDPRAGKKLSEAAVTLTLDDVTLEVAVRLAAEVAGYGVVRMDNVLFVTTAERTVKLQADADRLTPPPGGGLEVIDGGPRPANPPVPGFPAVPPAAGAAPAVESVPALPK